MCAPSSAAGMGLGNAAPVIGSIAVNPLPPPAATAVTITCSATDNSAVTRLVVTVSGGALPNGTLSQELGINAGAAVSGSIAWTTGAPGLYQVTCAATDDGRGSFGTSTPITTTSPPYAVEVVAAPNPPPEITSLTASATAVFGGSSVHLSAVASGSGPLVYSWTAGGGTIIGAGLEADWVAPAAAGLYTVTLTVTDAANLSAQRAVALRVVWATPGVENRIDGFFPARVAIDGAGTRYATDPRSGTVHVFSKTGQPLRTMAVDGLPTGVAVSRAGDRIYVADGRGALIRLYDAFGKPVGTLAGGALARPLALAVAADGRVFVADYLGADQPGRVRVFDAAGSLAGGWTLAAGYPTGVALDAAGTRVYVAASGGTVGVFDGSGTSLGAIGTFGGGAGQLIRPGGLTLASDGNLYVVDSFQGQISAFAPDGTFLSAVGEYGTGAGQLDVPVDVAADGEGQLVVTSTLDARVATFLLRGAAAPACPGDSDCDGIPDAWERAAGLDPYNAGDAGLDADGDGLSNADEYRYGTDPNRADSDGDGFTDGEEVLAGTDPLDPQSHQARVTVQAYGPAASLPGLVHLSASLQGPGACVTRWVQSGGPPVALRAGDTLAPSFVARAAGSYRFRVVGTCGVESSAPAEALVEVLNVAPRADAGPTLAVTVGGAVELDARASSDANGDPLTFVWDQVLGPPLAGTLSGAVASVRADTVGVSAFQLTATDALAASGTDTMHLVVVQPGTAGPAANVAGPLSGRAGQPVQLDGSESYGEEFSWTQLEGPPVTLTGTTKPRFVPPAAGRYVFELKVSHGMLVSPPARVEVYVAPSGGKLPEARIQAASAAVGLGAFVELDGTGSVAGGVGPAEFEWRQVSGPAAGLNGAAGAVATVVPFDPGLYVFELVVKQDGVSSLPARVALLASEPGIPLPTARAFAPPIVQAGKLVALRSAGSASGDGAALVYRWRQVAGPWVPLDGAAHSTASFRPPVRGLYQFELVVEDGHARSAPARVSVFARYAQGQRPPDWSWGWGDRDSRPSEDGGER